MIGRLSTAVYEYRLRKRCEAPVRLARCVQNAPDISQKCSHKWHTFGQVLMCPTYCPSSHLVLAFHLRHMFQVDRKSTRLNSSHANISYAVFCLKKKIL